MSGQRSGARFAASAAFLAAAIVAVLLIRSGLANDSPPQPARPATTQSQGGSTTTGTRVTLPTATTAVEPVFYVIKAGDTLEIVAEQQGTTVERLLILNPDVDPVALTIGQRIRVK